jgi:hypothetical protein
MAISQYLEQKVFEHFFKANAAAAVAQPTSYTVGLWTADPGDATTPGAGEVSGGAYARQPITFGAPAYAAGATTITNNGAAITFPTATANWGSISYAAIFDNAGNYMFSGPLVVGVTPTPQTVNTNGQLIFNAGQLSIKLT